MDFKLRSKEIHFSDEFVELNKLRKKCISFAREAREQFIKDCVSEFSTVYDFFEKCNKVGQRFIDRSIEKAIEIIVGYGVLVVDEELFIENFYWRYCTWFKTFDKINEKYISMNCNKEEVAEYKRRTQEVRDTWSKNEGNNVDELIGALQGGAFNRAASLMYIPNNNKVIVVKDGKANEEEIRNSLSMINALADSILESIFNIHFAIIDALRANGITNIATYRNVNDLKKSQALFNNFIKGLIPKDKEDEVIKEIIELDPYRSKIFEFLLVKYGDRNKEVEIIAEFLGYDYVKEYKYKVLSNYFKKLSVDTEEETLKSKENFIRYAECLCAGDITNYIEKINDILVIHDKKIRTVDNIEFNTREEANRARREINIISDILLCIDKENEEYITNAIKKIESSHLQTSLSEKYLSNLYKRLNKAIRAADEHCIKEYFKVNLLKDVYEVENAINRLIEMNLRTTELVEQKREELIARKYEIIKCLDEKEVNNIIRTHLFLNKNHIHDAIEKIENLYLKTDSVKINAIEYLKNNSDTLINEHLKKLEKAKRYENRQRKDDGNTNEFKKFMNKIANKFGNISGLVEEDKEAWTFITNNGLKSLEDLDVN